jgi:hypothetical protein
MPIPDGYQRFEGSERHAAIGARRVEEADPNEILSITIYVRRRPDAPLFRARNTGPLIRRVVDNSSHGGARRTLRRRAPVDEPPEGQFDTLPTFANYDVFL